MQYSHPDGPLLAVLRAREVILVDDLAADSRFRPYRPRALTLGARPCLALRLALDDEIRSGH